MRSRAQRPMSGAAQFKSAVPKRQRSWWVWRGGLEGERHKAAQGRAVLSNRGSGARTMRFMDLPAGYPPKPPRSFTR